MRRQQEESTLVNVAFVERKIAMIVASLHFANDSSGRRNSRARMGVKTGLELPLARMMLVLPWRLVQKWVSDGFLGSHLETDSFECSLVPHSSSHSTLGMSAAGE